MGFPTKNDNYWVIWGYRLLRKHSHVYEYDVYVHILKGTQLRPFLLATQKSFDWKAQNPLWIPVVNAIKRGVPSQLLGIIMCLVVVSFFF